MRPELVVLDGWLATGAGQQRAAYGLLNAGCCDVTMQYLFRDAVFFVLRTKNAVDGVWGAVAGFVVVADLHFS